MTRTPPAWFRVLTEATVIVASILLALFLDAWWGSVQERVEERETLDALRGEFEVNRDLLDAVVALHGRHEAFLAAFYGTPSARLTQQDPDSLLRGLNLALTEVVTFDPSMSTLDALVSGDRMRLLRDAELRAALIEWRRQLEDTREEAVHMLATLNRTVPLLRSLEALDAPTVPWTSVRTGAVDRIRTNAELEGHALLISFWRGQYAAELETLSSLGNEVLGLLGRP